MTLDKNVLWKKIKRALEQELNEYEIASYFNKVEIDNILENSIVLLVPSLFIKDQINKKYQSLLLNLFQIEIPNLTQLDYKIEFKQTPVTENNPYKEKLKEIEEEPIIQKHKALNPKYNFDTFVIGENNKFAAHAAMAIAKNPGKAYNPCLIYGNVGLGKTHLMQAIGNYAFQNFPKCKIMYVTSESFVNDFIISLQNKTQPKFKQKYRSVDILLVDDIHDLQKAQTTQEELFHTYNALHDAHKQIIFTCDRPIAELKNLTERLRSRFEMGLTVDLMPPNYETRVAILQQKFKERNSSIQISNTIIELIAEKVTSNIRDLEGCLTKLIGYGELVNKNITIEIAENQLKNFFAGPPKPKISVDLVQRVIADYFNVTPQDLKSKKRARTYFYPRQIAMYILRDITELSTTEIGLEFGGRDHTTVMHACQKIEAKIKTDQDLGPIIHELIRSIKEKGMKS